MLKLQPADRLLRLRVFVVSHSPSNQVSEYSIRSDHDRFLTHFLIALPFDNAQLSY